ncbi:hypothetical protein QQF73_00440 [Marinobacter sp. M216]|uniref:Nitroreductase domain-containing protein n=1 Tax=Marinobacter albus TaxID=3030833 RepID=A0ABT7H937_9GAMM|nr:hypothetical protein [Marinobacter sp. M216]MDK9556071.1 hypothetical protein [Marinobacter sp. M216]
MSLEIQKMPTLGYFNKIICDSLGLWSSDLKDIYFDVPANEEERKKALQDAFCVTKKDDDTYGTLSELISVTSEISPGQKEIVRKNKTIQSHINYFSKEDFASYDELVDFKGYIKVVIEDVYKSSELSDFAYKIYESSIMYYREFVREHAAKPRTYLDSYIFFVKSILIDLIESLSNDVSINKNHLSGNVNGESNDWPLRTFVDSVTERCGVSLHRLHQFHDFKLNHKNYSDKAIWNEDLSSQSINTRSKQVIGRLNKNNKIKWNGFYSIINPLLQLLPADIDEASFEVKAYSAFVVHNINRHLRELPSKDIYTKNKLWDWNYPMLTSGNNYFPVSDQLDLIVNDEEVIDGQKIQASMQRYHELIKNLRLLSYSIIGALEVPSTLEFLYSKNSMDDPIEAMFKTSAEVPIWICEWNRARISVSSSDAASALHHYKNSLESAKYSAGPLFIILYTEICAFCKHQYKELKKNNEEHLFDRFYEPLGAEAAKYAILIGYAPGTSRDPKTLIPRSTSPKKSAFLMYKIDLKMKAIT